MRYMPRWRRLKQKVESSLNRVFDNRISTSPGEMRGLRLPSEGGCAGVNHVSIESEL